MQNDFILKIIFQKCVFQLIHSIKILYQKLLTGKEVKLLRDQADCKMFYKYLRRSSLFVEIVHKGKCVPKPSGKIVFHLAPTMVTPLFCLPSTFVKLVNAILLYFYDWLWMSVYKDQWKLSSLKAKLHISLYAFNKYLNHQLIWIPCEVHLHRSSVIQ